MPPSPQLPVYSRLRLLPEPQLKYVSNLPLGSVYMALVVNLDDWNSLPPDLQLKVLKAADDLEKAQWKGRQLSINSFMDQAVTKYGARVVNPSPAEVDKLLMNVDPVLKAWKERVGPDSAKVLDAINQVLGTDYK